MKPPAFVSSSWIPLTIASAPLELLWKRLFTFHLNYKCHPWGLINDMQMSISVWLCWKVPAKFFGWLCSSQCSRKKNRGLGVLLGVGREPRPRPIRGWVASLFCVKTRGVGGEILSLWIEFHVRKQCKVREFFLWPRPAKSMRWLIIITLLAELGGSDWLVISFMGGEVE